MTNISRSEDHSGWHTMNAIGKRQDNLLRYDLLVDYITGHEGSEDQNWDDRGSEHKNRTQRTRSWSPGPKI